MMFNASADMMDIGISALRTISLCFPAAGLGIAFSNFFQAIGEGKNSLLISVLRQLVILLPCAWIISRIGTLNQVWLAFPIAEVFSFFVSLLLTRITYNIKLKRWKILPPTRINHPLVGKSFLFLSGQKKGAKWLPFFLLCYMVFH